MARIDIEALKRKHTSTNKYGNEEIDAGSFADEVVKIAGAAIAPGQRVVLNVEGKQIDIVSISGGMMRDRKGLPWGTLSLINGMAHLETIAPATPSAPLSGSHSKG